MKNFEVKYLTKTLILGREGWTKTSFLLFICEHDKEIKNIYNKKSPNVKLYDIDKIEQIEKTDKFITFVEKNKKRTIGAKKSVKTKTEKLINYVNSLEIEIPNFDKNHLFEIAINHYNYYKFNKSILCQNYESNYVATKYSDKTFLNRITINYLRHNCSLYDNELLNIFGKIGINIGYDILKKKVNSAIFSKYPFLFDSE